MLKKIKNKKTVFIYLVLLAIVAALWQFIPDPVRTITWSNPLDAGENWLFALNGTPDNYWFPFFPVVIAAIQYHFPAWLQAGACKFLFVLPVILAFCAGALIHSSLAGLLAAALSAALGTLLFWHLPLPYEQHLEQVLIASALLTLVAGLSVKFRSYALRSFSLGLLMAAALYAKGIFALFIPVVFVYEAYGNKNRAPFRKQWPAAAVLLAAVLAWVIVNRVCLNEYVLLEGSNRAGSNITTGALGFVSTIEGDWRALSGLSPGQNVVLWAAGEILSHPLRYIAAVAHRSFYFLFTQPLVKGLPLLAFLGLCGVFRLRRLTAARPLLLMAGYQLLIHLLMPVEGRYFLPMWFLVCVLAGIFLADIPAGTARADGDEDAHAKALFYTAAAPLVVCWAASFALLLAYPLRSGGAHDLRGLEARYPAVPWLYEMAARDAALAGDLARAAQSRRQASALEESNMFRRIDYLKTAFAAGGISGAELQDNFRSYREYHALLLAGLRYAEEGKPEKAGKVIPCALQLCVRNSNNLRYVTGTKDAELLRKMRRSGADYCLRILTEMLTPLEAKRNLALQGRLTRIYPGWRQPELLFSDFEAGNMEDTSRAAPRGIGLEPGSKPELQVCQGITPAAEPPPPAPGPARFKALRGLFTAARSILTRASGLSAGGSAKAVSAQKPFSGGPAALLDSCLNLAGKNKKEQALQACQGVIYAVESGPESGTQEQRTLRSEASFKSYELLSQLGRGEEAREVLVWTVADAPPSWPGLARARALLEHSEKK